MSRKDKIVSEYYQPVLLTKLQLAELISLVLLLACVIVYVKILLKKQFCHPNLLVLLLCQPLVHIGALMMRPLRMVLDQCGLLNQLILDVINIVSDTLISTSFLIVLAYSIERCVAIKYVDTYEELWKKATMGWLLFFGALVYSVFLIIVWYFDWVPNPIAFGGQYVLFTLAIVFFVVLRHVCLKSYRVVADRKDSTLNERFQTARNLKAARLLIRLAPYKCLTNFVSLSFYYWTFEHHTPYYLPFYTVFYFYLSHIQLYIQMLLTISGHSVLKAEMWSFFGWKLREEPEAVTNVLGQQMIFNIDEEKELYFQRMQADWAHTGGSAQPAVEGRKQKYAAEP